MRYALKGTQLEVTDKLAEAIERKMAALDRLVKHFGTEVRGWVEVERTTRHHRTGEVYRAELQVHVARKRFVAEAVGQNIFEALDKAHDHLRAELRSHKDRLTSKTKQLGRRWKAGDNSVA